ncbi:MAG: pyruvate, phosphate dikinase [Gammaproteobacteria bacterium]|jgi:pyruvate,orthophosphate dikinase|nr:pyruvate, phosphate dikinase [Gammaproteobacteria bacterium]MDH3863049.1 pyruvate, phosphate dikinase [Gammaproteobacteria bacterium]MDH3906531.1 pyruvate, phosphate dikinase [Gammaproteobacteria bacterium]MDH4005036.1 pyruvate, phosphate dikinase [Gammaproteobacteria bacterium]
MKKKLVYSFAEGDGKNKKLLGGKGANLCEMTQIGLNVPPGFVITTEACLDYLVANEIPAGLMKSISSAIAELEVATSRKFGAADNPLLVSVRSGSALSMPGMMDTILNLGLNDETLAGLIEQTGDERFAYDAYRRFIQLFGKVALGIEDEKFDEHFNDVKQRAGVNADVGLEATHLREISEKFLLVVRQETGDEFPQDVMRQLQLAVEAVFRSWMGKRAIDYRREFNITPDMANGTAVNVCTMVFGNMGNDCATGVGFTRNPGTGCNEMFGEYLTNAQGEDVVAGIRTPKPLTEMEQEMPEQYAQLVELRNKLETHYGEVQDYEFTIEKGTLYCLQTRNGKMNAAAKVKTSVDMFSEGLISKDQALLRIEPEILEQLLHPTLDPDSSDEPVAHGLPASPGAASGKCVFDADLAEKLGNTGEQVILVREETRPEDIHGFFAAEGILTSRGGKTSHAAVVARGMGKPCVAGAEGIDVDVALRMAHVGGHVIHEGDTITLDGGTGEVYLGAIRTLEADFSDDLRTLLEWADETADLKVMANADTPDAARRAREYGAMGIGLCRTERMFNASDRLPIVIDMILADNAEDRKAALNRLLPIQRADFIDLFTVMSPDPVTVRLLDPPMHEFLPTEQQLLEEIRTLSLYRDVVRGRETALATMVQPSPLPEPFSELNEEIVIDAISTKERMLKKVRELQETNPMLGHRGVRLGITYPEIYEMQIEAILEAAAECAKNGIKVQPEIMVPQVITSEELQHVRRTVDRRTAQLKREFGEAVDFRFGTMIETVRACTRARKLAASAEFFSFGTNDLTQATFSFSREDAENKFLPMYNDSGILQDNPFEVLDVQGVGQLINMAVYNGRQVRSDLKIGICGEQGGHPESIRFCHHVDLNYVSCSGPRVPIARLAAANAKLLQEEYVAFQR